MKVKLLLLVDITDPALRYGSEDTATVLQILLADLRYELSFHFDDKEVEIKVIEINQEPINPETLESLLC